MPTPLAAQVSQGYWPLAVLAICVGLIVVLITVVRVHAFMALIIAGFTAGLLSKPGTLPGKPQDSHWIRSVELTTQSFGEIAGEIGVIVGLAAIIGLCMMESGAADKVVRRFSAVFGEKRAGLAILIASYLLSMPTFFDTFFMLLLPIALSLALRTGKNYVLYILAICSGGTITHGLIVPHPGPLAMAEILNIDVGLTILVGAAVGAVPVAISWFLIKRIDAKLNLPVRPTGGRSLEEMSRGMDKPESELPSFMASIVPVLLPIVLISMASVFKTLNPDPDSYALVKFVGNPNVALVIGAVLSIWVVAKQRGWDLATIGAKVGPAFETAGVIILITSAGGAFGLMLKHAGVGGAIREAAAGYSINLIILAWLVAAVIRIAQGSTTVALLTTAGMIQPMIADGNLPYHPVYIFTAIAFGGLIFSWMNDSGFWVVGRLSGFTEKETFRTWTTLLTFNSVIGLLTSLVFSWIFPMAHTNQTRADAPVSSPAPASPLGNRAQSTQSVGIHIGR